MTAYYNEIDPFKAEVLREAVEAGAIAPGEVDERSIRDVWPDDLRGFTQCHFFAGGGFWSLALRQAGWPDDREVWTGSCPCPSFSAAGKGEGFADPRHLWPEWIRLIRERRPGTIFGEQVAAAIGHGWLDLVSGDLEAEGYAVAAAVLGAHSVGAPHIRQRLYFVAHAAAERYDRRRAGEAGRWQSEPERSRHAVSLDHAAGARCDGPVEGPERHSWEEARLRGSGERCQDGGLGDAAQRGFGIAGSAPGRAGHPDSADGALRMAHTNGLHAEQPPRERPRPTEEDRARPCGESARRSEPRGLADADGRDARAEREQRSGELGQQPQDGGAGGLGLSLRKPGERRARGLSGEETPKCGAGQQDGREFDGSADAEQIMRPSPLNGFWRDADWIGCRDGKWRPVEPGTFPLAHGGAARVGRLRLYGDAICVPAAQAFIEAYLTTDH